MDLFKQNLAPIASEAWEEINERASEVIQASLSARKILFVKGPLGIDTEIIPTGRLQLIENEKSNVHAGLYDVQPLLETRISFDLGRWELDNILRGADDIDLESLEQAAQEIALFEEDTIYNGNKKANIKGLIAQAGQTYDLAEDSNALLKQIAKAVLHLKDAFAEAPYYMVVGDEAYEILSQAHGGHLLRNLVEKMIGGEIIRSKVVKGALLLPYNHADLELTVGQDYKVGYSMHDKDNVNLFIMNAFTLRILDEDLIVYFKK